MTTLPQSTAYVVMFKAFLATDHVTEATGKTIAITISKNGGAFGNPNAGATNATEVSSGWYKVSLDATDTNTVGPLAVRGAVATIDDIGVLYDVQAAFATAAALVTVDGIVDDILLDTAEIGTAGAGLININLPNQTMDIIGNITGNLSGSVGSVTGAVGSVTGNVGGNVNGNVVGSVGSVVGAIASVTTVGSVTGSVGSIAANGITATSLDATAGVEIADAVLDRDMSVGTDSGSPTVRTVRQALRFLRNKWSITTGTLTVTKEDDATASWTAAVTGTAGADPITTVDPAS